MTMDHMTHTYGQVGIKEDIVNGIRPLITNCHLLGAPAIIYYQNCSRPVYSGSICCRMLYNKQSNIENKKNTLPSE
jgi:hypothetical protein